MSRISTFIIGRHPDCHLHLDDSSVSRRHAEFVFTPDGRYYVTDRNSTGGTFIYRDSAWSPLRQAFVAPTDRLRFGKHEEPVSSMESLRVMAGAGGGPTADPGKAAGPGKARQSSDDGLDPRKKLMRDPETGELVEVS